MPDKRVRVLYHDHCFDGSASAAYFSQFYQDHIDASAKFAYTGMAHTADQLFQDSLFDGDRVSRGLKERRAVEADLVRFRHDGRVLRLVCDGDLGAGDRRAGRIGDDSGNAGANFLRERGRQAYQADEGRE